MASPLRILTIGSEKIRADKVAYVLDDNTIRRVFYEGVFITTTDSIATLQGLIPELITLNYTEGGNVYVNAVGVTSIQDIVNETLITLNTIAPVTVLDSVSDVTTAINLKLATGGGAISGSISINQVAYGIGSDTIGGESTFTYNNTDDVLTTEGHLLTPQATNPETTNPNDNLWINSGDNHLYRGNRDVESTVHFNVRNDEGVTIPLGAPLYSKGEIGGSNRVLVGVADASNSAKMPVIGIAMVEMNTTTTKDGNAIASGILNENLTGFTGLTDNTVIYVTAHGGTWSTVSDLLSPTKPTGVTHLVQNVGICIRTNGAYTTIQGFNVAAIGRTNDTPNQISIPGNITAASFVISGGTATQYVRGNGAATELEISQDLSPQLGAALDTQGYAITGNYATDSRRAILIENGSIRQLSVDDSGDFLITTSTAATTVVIPDSATADFTLGTEIEIAQKGAGAVTVSAATNVTLNASATGAVTVPNQWGGASLKKIDANEWLLVKKGSTGGGGGGVDTFNTLTGDVTISDGTNITFNTVGNNIEINAAGGGGGTVTSVTTNAPLSVASGTSTPDLSITQATTSVDGFLTSTDWNTFNNKLSSVSGDTTPVLSGDLDVNGNNIVSSVGSGLDVTIKPDGLGNVVLDGIKYPQADGTAGQVLQTNGAGQLSFATAGGGSGTVTSVTTNAPLSVASGTSTPAISIATATTSADGFLTSTDWNTFNNKLSSVAGDTLPVLSGNLDVNGNSIVSAVNGNISITPDGTGNVILDGINYPQADGTIDQVLKTDGAGQLSFTSQTSGTVTSVGGTGTVNGLTLTGTVTSSGNLTLGGGITGFLPLAGGIMSGAITGNQDITGKRPIVTDTTQTINLTLGTHEGSFIYSDNGAAVTANILPYSTQAFPVGTEVDIIQAGLGQVTVTPGIGVNLNGFNTAIPITAQWGGVTLKQITADNWIIVGKI